MRRPSESLAARSRGRRTPESETRNVDPRDIATLPEEWSREAFFRDLGKGTERTDEPTPED